MKAVLETLFAGKSLTREEAARAMDLMISGNVAPESIAALLGALRAKGETVAELIGFTEAIRKRMIPVPSRREDCIDCCGTGGDAAGTFNISTAVAFVLAGGGAAVAKHGNRSVSSRSGSGDVVEAMGITIDRSAEECADCLDRFGFAFLMAPAFNPALGRVAAVRRAIAMPTLFNLLGPLVNPAPVRRQLIGVYDRRFLRPLVEVLQALGSVDVMVASADDGLDEISLSASTQVAHLRNGQIKEFTLQPEDLGFKRADRAALAGGDARENAGIIAKILDGERGPRRDIVIANASAGFVVAGKAKDFAEGRKLAEMAIDSGRAREVVKSLREYRGVAIP